MILKAIAAKENITVEASEIDERIRIMAGSYGQEFDKVKKRFEDSNMIDGMENELLTRKVMDFLESQSKITVVKKEIII